MNKIEKRHTGIAGYRHTEVDNGGADDPPRERTITRTPKVRAQNTLRDCTILQITGLLEKNSNKSAFFLQKFLCISNICCNFAADLRKDVSFFQIFPRIYFI
jgi:hypothetical protein